MSDIACCKKVRCGPGDDDERRPPLLIAQEKGKGPKKTTTKKKRKRGDIETDRAAVVAIATEHAKRGSKGSGIRIGDQLSLA